MKTPALKDYSKHYAQMKASEAICKSLKQKAYAELGKQMGGTAIVNGIEFHQSKHTSITMPEAVKKKINKLRKKALKDGSAKVETTNIIVGKIPKSTVNAVLSKASKEYAKRFKN